MNNKSITGLVLAVLIIGGGIWYTQSMKADQAKVGGAEVNGNLYVGVKDATAEIQNVDDIALTIRKVELHSESQGWITVSDDAKTFRLLELKKNGRTALYAQKALSAGHFDQARVTLGDVVIWTKANGQVEAAMPGSTLTLKGEVEVRANENTHLMVDFLADKSLHVAKGDKYIFTPVVTSEVRGGAQVTVNADTLDVSGGTVSSGASVGMDLSGASRPNYELSTNNSLEVKSQSSGPLAGSVTFLLNGSTYLAGSASQQQAAVSGQNTAGVALPQGVTLGSEDSAGIPIKVDASGNVDVNSGANLNGGGLNSTSSLNVNGGVNLGY